MSIGPDLVRRTVEKLEAKMLPAPEATLIEQTPDAFPSERRNWDLFSHENLNPLMESRPKRVFGTLGSFLNSRIGHRWVQVLLELSDRLETEDRFRAVLPRVGELVEFRTVERGGKLCHGSGLMMGQPLRAGWRRRLYVCPRSGRLLRMPLENGARAGGM